MNGYNFDTEALRKAVKSRMEPKRFAHTLGVERAAALMGEIYLPEKIQELRCAALLHDVTKNETIEKQLQYFDEFGIMKKDFYKNSPALLHSVTAALIIPRDFPEYASDDIVSAVRWHTTGRAGMTVFEAIIYLADLIEDGRRYPELAELRDSFWNAGPRNMSDTEKHRHLYKTIVKSIDNTVLHLIKGDAYIDPNTIECRNYYLKTINNSTDRKSL